MTDDTLKMTLKLTRRQKSALRELLRRHDEYKQYSEFATIHLGENTSAVLRRLSYRGLVSVTKGGRGMRQFFSITEAGRAALKEEEVE